MHKWKGHLLASGIHLAISLCIAALAAALVFGLWYPYPYREISGGRSLFMLVVGVDVIMGPLITLIIFNRAKRRREMVTDFTVVGLLQIAALTYGLWAVFVARPVHLVFEYSRMTVVHAVDIDDRMLARAPVGLRTLPVTGPTPIALRPFRDSSEQFDATMAALEGAPLAARSDLWQPYANSKTEILRVARPVSQLLERFESQRGAIDSAIIATGKTPEKLVSLPLVGRGNAWTVLLDADSAQPVGYVPVDSF